MLLVLFVLAGCDGPDALRADDPETVKAALIERLGSHLDATVLGMAAVHTPQGLWNVHVLSQPPDRIVVYQVRQDGRAEFGATSEQVWRLDPWTSEVQAMPAAYRYFLHSHEIMRLGDRLVKWDATGFGAQDRVGEETCRILELTDEFGQPVSLCLAESGMPLRIRLHLPEIYGGETMDYIPEQWRDGDGRTYLSMYTLRHAGEEYHWNFQGLGEVDPNENRIEPPPGLGEDEGGGEG